MQQVDNHLLLCSNYLKIAHCAIFR